MGLFDRLTRRTVNFAEGNSIQQARSQGTSEIGVSGDSFIGFEQTETRTDKLTVDDYIKMRQKDGTVASLYNILTLPVIGNGYEIKADENDANEEQANFIREALLDPPHKGGMDVPLSLVLADMLRATLEGFRLFEKVYQVIDGKVTYKKLASRDSRTITLQRSDDGGYGGAVQRANFKGEWYDVEIPAWKTFLFTFGKDKSFLYGESAFKAAYYHYDKKHRAYYIEELSGQARAVPPIVAGPDTTENFTETDTSKAKAMKALSQLGRLKPNVWKPKGLDITPLDMSVGAKDMMPYIDHQNTEMARSILAQFLMLGTSGSRAVGSWALSENHEDVFVTAIKGLMKNMEDHINYYLIPDLIDLNFANPAYPEFHYEDMTNDAKTALQAAFTALIQAGKVSDAVAKGVEEQVATSLDIDLDAIQKQLDKEAQKRADAGLAPAVAPPAAPQPPDAQNNPQPPQNAPQDKPAPKPINQEDRPGRPFNLASGSDRSPQPNAALILHRSSRSSISSKPTSRAA